VKKRVMKSTMQIPVEESQSSRPRPIVPIRDDVEARASSTRDSSHSWKGHWLSAREFATMMNRHEQTVYSWVADGTLAEFGIPVCKFSGRRPHTARLWILSPF
jgi:hypothetical protein